MPKKSRRDEPTTHRDQHTPRSFGILLRTLRVIAELEMDELGQILAIAPGRFGPRSFPRQIMSLIEKSKRGHYWHFARYANWSGLPVGVLFLLSRFVADLRENEPEEVRKLAAAVIALCKHADAEADRLAAVNIDKLSADEKEFDALYQRAQRDPGSNKKNRTRRRTALIARDLINAYPEQARAAQRSYAKRHRQPDEDSA